MPTLRSRTRGENRVLEDEKAEKERDLQKERAKLEAMEKKNAELVKKNAELQKKLQDGLVCIHLRIVFIMFLGKIIFLFLPL